QQLLVREQFLFLLPAHALRGHAVDATEVAAVRQTDPQIVDAPPVGIMRRAVRIGHVNHAERDEGRGHSGLLVSCAAMFAARCSIREIDQNNLPHALERVAIWMYSVSRTGATALHPARTETTASL